MKFNKLFAAVAFLSAVSMAAPDVSPRLVNLKVSSVESKGSVLRETHQHPYTHFLVAIPVEVSTGNVCTKFVGQENVNSTSPKAPLTLQAKGVVNPLTEACIEIFPMPIKTEFTFDFSVLTGGFVGAPRIQKQVVELVGAGNYLVVLDMGNDTVTVSPVK